jgi:hypothetical protein
MTNPGTQAKSHLLPGGRWHWHGDWATLPVPERGVRNQRTHGIAVLRDRRVVIFHQAIPSVLIYSPAGQLLERWGAYPGAHGLTCVERHGRELLWLTDEFLGLAELVDLSGNVLAKLEKPDLPIYREKTFCPTWVAEDSASGEPVRLWLADGYGSHLVHAYDGRGRYEFSLTGEEGAGRFDCPHSVAIDPRAGRRGALLVADRGNHRVQEFSRSGDYLGTWGGEYLDSPNGFDFRGGQCVLSELHGRVTVVDAGNSLVEFLGGQPNARHLPLWPNVDRSLVLPGLFNSPHAAAWGPDGEIYVVEWIKHGRVTRLEPATESDRVNTAHTNPTISIRE